MRSPHARRRWWQAHRRQGDPSKAASSLRWSDRLIEAGALFLLVFTPLAYGTVEPWSEAIAELVVLGMVVVWIVGLLSDWELRVELPRGWLPASLFLAIVFFQATPLPHALIALVSPWTTGFYDTALTYTGASMATMPLSLAPQETLREALKLGAVAAFFLVCFNVYRTRAQAQRAVWTMIVVGALIALFGIVQRMTWNGRLYWIGPEAPGGNPLGPFGPFVNRAHFVSLITVVVPLALALWLASHQVSTRKRLTLTWKDRLRVWTSRQAGPVNLLPVLVLVMGGASLVSGSRGGIVAFISALACMAFARGRRGTATIKVAMATLLIVAAGTWIGNEMLFGTVERLVDEVKEAPDSPRLQVWSDSFALAQRNPILGTGLSSFGSVYQLVQTIQAPVTFSHAESDWVQIFTDTGLVGMTLALAVVSMLALALFRSSGSSELGLPHEIPLAAGSALVGVLVGGIGNYTLPVMAGWLFLGLAMALGLQSRAHSAP